MAKRSKRMRAIDERVDVTREYSVEEAISVLKKEASAKFDESVNVSIKLGIDPKKNEHNVRGTVSLPHGTGKKIRVAVAAKGDKAKDAHAAGADIVGDDDLVEKIKAGIIEFDVLIATPDMMKEVAKHGKVLGPRGLMPRPQSGTVTMDISSAVRESKAGKIEFKAVNACVNKAIGKISFDEAKIAEHVRVLLREIQKAKPATAKGEYLCSMVLSTTMGPGLKVNPSSAIA